MSEKCTCLCVSRKTVCQTKLNLYRVKEKVNHRNVRRMDSHVHVGLLVIIVCGLYPWRYVMYWAMVFHYCCRQTYVQGAHGLSEHWNECNKQWCHPLSRAVNWLTWRQSLGGAVNWLTGSWILVWIKAAVIRLASNVNVVTASHLQALVDCSWICIWININDLSLQLIIEFCSEKCAQKYLK